MRAVDIIEKKRDGHKLNEAEINFIFQGYLDGEIPEYQISSFLMAVYFRGLDERELNAFTKTMMNSGDLVEFDGIHKFLVDKHSTGGVGDKTTIALAPLLAAFDIGTAKLSGKGLGHTGGTIDKLESIPGFIFPVSRDELIAQVNETGIGIMGYSENIVPLDKKLYSLRDVTATVSSIPLIASSIMSKKLAVYADAIILDVKVGAGAFMKTKKEAKELAHTMINIGKSFDRKIIVHLSDMSEPLGMAIGNSLEVIEAIETLKGNGPVKFSNLIKEICGTALYLRGDVKSIQEGAEKTSSMMKSGAPLTKLKAFIKACGGNENVVDDYSLLPKADYSFKVKSSEKGYVKSIDAEMVGKSAMILGAGRATKEDSIDYSVGVVLAKKVGDIVETGETIATFYYNDSAKLDDAVKMLKSSFEFDDEKIETKEIILETIK
ncbi:thymidine phosphorylase [Aureibacter tunicatorum]|uniref:thymidine phosphorylase n=1 Tax=Aureibacter tunicatorum TaxID=866807 RepID=A0AAE4BSX0_9BACT|nr:thymidine phosphorylase [Aureibacter tunicatorum]MDR6241629.1 pyrimidine-nucleoside phosphorylase [Aureibacter tunicatorum]BDD07255.1 pyrimidine-nucleoside phosphorylase [Aureibacter tunicatorum]